MSVKKLSGVITFIVCIPLLGTIFIKPDKDLWKKEEEDISIVNEYFEISVQEDIGTFRYKPETLTGLLMYRIIPEDIVFSRSEDYVVGDNAVQDPEQEYLKALSIVCRSNIVSAWESEQRPDVLDYDKMQFGANDFYKVYHVQAGTVSDDTRRIRINEINRAVEATYGAVITREGEVVTAPFFTTAPSDMLVSEAGKGVGFSLNYAYELAASGLDFYEILKYFYEDIRVIIYE